MRIVYISTENSLASFCQKNQLFLWMEIHSKYDGTVNIFCNDKKYLARSGLVNFVDDIDRVDMMSNLIKTMSKVVVLNRTKFVVQLNFKTHLGIIDGRRFKMRYKK